VLFFSFASGLLIAAGRVVFRIEGAVVGGMIDLVRS